MTPFGPMNQGMVEHLTGFSRELLRKWEQRYGFPMPTRGARGQRLYTHADVDQLLLIRRLLQAGMRPAQVVGLSREALQARLDGLKQVDADAPASQDERLAALFDALNDPFRVDGVQALLSRWLYLDGPLDFACDTLGVLNRAIGEAWSDGRCSIHQEHWYAECMRRVLNAARAGCVMDRRWRRVLLTTPPGESHELALLGLELALATQGVDALYIGAQTPVDELCRAADQLAVEVVALSVSQHTQTVDLSGYLRRVRDGVPPDCEVWVGGQGAVDGGAMPDRVRVFPCIRQAVQHWQHTHLPG